MQQKPNSGHQASTEILQGKLAKLRTQWNGHVIQVKCNTSVLLICYTEASLLERISS